MVDSGAEGGALKPGVQSRALNEIANGADGRPAEGSDALSHHAEPVHQTVGAAHVQGAGSGVRKRWNADNTESETLAGTAKQKIPRISTCARSCIHTQLNTLLIFTACGPFTPAVSKQLGVQEDAVTSPEGRGLLDQLDSVLVAQGGDQLDGRRKLGELPKGKNTGN